MSTAYDFDGVIDRRNTSSMKWDQNAELFGNADVLSMWVADMDFPCPEPVLDAIRRRVDHPVLGYTIVPESVYDAIIGWVERRHGWRIRKEWIVVTPGIVNALHTAVRAFTHPGDEVIVQPPVYYPFFRAVKNSGAQLLYNQLIFDGARYTMDFAGLEALFRPATRFPIRIPKARLFVLCSPHNPVGRVWTGEELARLGDICLANDCVLLSDEIHCDLMLPGTHHTVTATISSALEQHTITFMSASKTFNLAGLDTSFAVIPNAQWRRQFTAAQAGHGSTNLFGLVALEAALRHGDDYLTQLRAYLAGNVEYFIDYVEQRLRPLRVIRPEGTYLVWVDMRGLGMDAAALQSFVRTRAKLALDDGYAFGPGGEGFQRFNLACPRRVLEEALKRLECAVADLKGGSTGDK
jgi:cysteine-S-conjugate beta-lyase